jgi:hypothetical protein
MCRKSILSILGLFVVSAICGAVENPNVGSPFKAQNAPTHSGQQQRYVTRGNPYGKSGNDIVTGNVGGGKLQRCLRKLAWFQIRQQFYSAVNRSNC